MRLTRLFNEFFESEKAGGLILVFVTAVSLVLANSAFQTGYIQLWHYEIAGQHLVHWINDGLMCIFFLLIGLELEREIYLGELSNIRNASLPIFGALGGMLVPAGIFLLFNFGGPAQGGAGIPMATDIAFAVGILSLLGKRVPASLKVFLTALAVIDDLGAVLVIAFFYTTTLSLLNLGIALAILSVLFILNRLKVYNLLPYLVGGVFAWYFMLQSGVHATITGVILAFLIPFGDGSEKSPSYILQRLLHKPVAFLILPLFALANTCIALGGNWHGGLTGTLSLGIISGLILGKPIGIVLFSLVAVRLGIGVLPDGLKWKNIIGAGLLGGIGFTMSIFITLLAFDDGAYIDSSKIAILIASCIAGIAGFITLKLTLPATEELPGKPEHLSKYQDL
ncbi:MAG: Na+/H+ antiporter NhaA [Bacteroidota bacterium]